MRDYVSNVHHFNVSIPLHSFDSRLTDSLPISPFHLKSLLMQALLPISTSEHIPTSLFLLNWFDGITAVLPFLQTKPKELY